MLSTSLSARSMVPTLQKSDPGITLYSKTHRTSKGRITKSLLYNTSWRDASVGTACGDCDMKYITWPRR